VDQNDGERRKEDGGCLGGVPAALRRQRAGKHRHEGIHCEKRDGDAFAPLLSLCPRTSAIAQPFDVAAQAVGTGKTTCGTKSCVGQAGPTNSANHAKSPFSSSTRITPELAPAMASRADGDSRSQNTGSNPPTTVSIAWSFEIISKVCLTNSNLEVLTI